MFQVPGPKGWLSVKISRKQYWVTITMKTYTKIPSNIKDGWLRSAPEAEPVRRLTRGVLSFTSHKKSQTGENGEMERRRRRWEIQFQTSAANRLIGEVVQSRRRPILGPSPGWKPNSAFTFMNLWRHYAKWAFSKVSSCEIGLLTQRSLKARMGWFANILKASPPIWKLHHRHNFTST